MFRAKDTLGPRGMGRFLRLAAVGAMLLVSLGCVSGSLFAPPPPPGGEPWEAPPDSHPSQRLYRVKYEGPEGKLSFKLSLYLASPLHYRMQAADALGRKAWTLSLDGQGGSLWLNHREKTYCRAADANGLALVPLARLPLAALPKLLLGRLPAEPAADLRRNGEHLSFLDSRGQLWNGALRAGQVDWWSLVENGEPIAWWRREDSGGTFTHLGTAQQVRWREITREPLAQTLQSVEVPKGFAAFDCSTGT